MLYDIRLEGMEFRAYHGCYDLEQRVGNRFVVDMKITVELGRVAEDDDVRQAVNYFTVYELVRAAMAVTQRTIERVACNIIAAVRERFPQVEAVECRVTKLAPPLGGKVERVSVTLRG